MDIRTYTKINDDIKNIRIDVFVNEQGFIDEFDDIDDQSIFFVAYFRNIPVGTCRLYFDHKKNSFILGRLAVIKKYRNKKYGSSLIKTAEKFIKGKPCKVISLHSQYDARDFYIKNGYHIASEIDYEQDCPHVWMSKDLSK